MNLIIRPEGKKDYEAVEHLTREAFWNLFKPGCDEHLLAHKLRQVPAFLPELDYVAERNGEVVGNIMYSRAKIFGEGGEIHEVLTFGPLSVLPSLQRAGIGSALIRHTQRLAEKLGFGAIVIFGHPAFYHKFGFTNAEMFRITTSDGKNFEAFMAMELREGALRGIPGRFCEDPVFHIEPEELEVFERKFPHKEKYAAETQSK